mgnify:CR=1 FL=1|jgi:hypothetical protein
MVVIWQARTEAFRPLVNISSVTTRGRELIRVKARIA